MGVLRHAGAGFTSKKLEAQTEAKVKPFFCAITYPMVGWRQENWVLDFDGVRYEMESYVFFFFQLAAIFGRVSTCLKCLFRAVSSLHASLPPRSGRNKSIGFPQALLSPAVRYVQDKCLYILVKQQGISGAVRGG